MHTTHDVTDDRREADRMREELDLIEAQLIARPESSAADYMERRRLLSIGPDRAAYLQFERETEVGDMVRESLQQQRADLITTLAELEGKARRPHPQEAHADVGVVPSPPVAQVPAPAPAKPAFVEPTLVLLREQAKAKASTPPVAAPVASQQPTKDEDGEDGEALLEAARQRSQERKKRLSGER
jgi:hypothetical protein